MLSNPIISCIQLSIAQDKLDPVSIRNLEPGVRHKSHLQLTPFRHSVDFVLHRAPICINGDVKHQPESICGNLGQSVV